MSGPFLIEVAIEPKTEADREKLGLALAELVAADPFLCVTIDRESGQSILKGPDETHLDSKVDVLKRTCKIDISIGAPQAAYRETLSRKIEKDYTYKRHKGGTAQFARVKFIFEPEKAGAGASFESKVAGGAVPEEYIAGVEAGIKAATKSGLLAGFPVVDVKVILIDGAFHDVDSSVEAFEIASRAAFREALKEGSILLEPIMKVEVTAPEDYPGFVTGDLRARRAKISDQRMRDNVVVIDALVPLANTFGYANQLRSGTQSRGTFSMQFSHYAPAPLPPDRDGPSAPAIALRA